MAFLDNSGDIILDAVLTDAGRKRLAAGDGSFRIAKFALADDEVDYSLYDTSAASGHQDLRILQLPVFEAFTNNTSVLKNKLLTYADNTLLYLPVIKLNDQSRFGAQTNPLNAGYYVSVDGTTSTYISDNNADAFTVDGFRVADDANAGTGATQITFDQGLDTTDLTLALLSDTNRNLMETQYIVEVDNRLLQIATMADGSVATPTFIDDDSVASYYLSKNSNADYFEEFNITPGQPPTCPGKVIGGDNTGRLGLRFKFGLRATQDAQTGTSLFSQLGKTGQTVAGVPAATCTTVDTVVRITGFTTGYRVDLSLKLLKKE